MDIDTIKSNLTAALADYRAKVHKAPAPEVRKASLAVRKLQAALAGAISRGAQPCVDCGNHPHGMIQSGTLGKEVIEYFEVGCLGCPKPGKRTRGATPESATAAWNKRYGSPGRN